jgi:hypothetical protein
MNIILSAGTPDKIIFMRELQISIYYLMFELQFRILLSTTVQLYCIGLFICECDNERHDTLRVYRVQPIATNKKQIHNVSNDMYRLHW